MPKKNKDMKLNPNRDAHSSSERCPFKQTNKEEDDVEIIFQIYHWHGHFICDEIIHCLDFTTVAYLRWMAKIDTFAWQI